MPANAIPTQSWNGYKWSPKNKVAIRLGDNVSSIWDPFLSAASTQWSAAIGIDYAPLTGTTTPTTCAAKYGTVQACSANYGATGWLGYTSVWTGGGFITQATIKLNEYYFSQTKYNTAAWRASAVCHEAGHALGLAHTNEVRTDANTGSCMDITNDPSGLLGGSNGTLANIAPNAVDFAALAAIYGTSASSMTGGKFLATHSLAVEGFEPIETIAAIPEPASWALLIVGFGAVGTAMRRRPATLAA